MPTEQIKHTPGPWVVESCGANYADIADANGNVIASASDGVDDPQTILENARLIAAAPDLLEALRQIAENAPTEEPDPRTMEYAPAAAAGARWDAAQIARAAIAKAEGASNV